MRMMHHDSTRTYEQAASEAATHARKIMEAKIEAGRASAMAIFERIHNEVPRDAIVRANALGFRSDEGLVVEYGNASATIHKHALGQMAAKAGVPGAYLAELANGGQWQRDLASEILRKHFGEGSDAGQRFLVREINGQARGFLSDRYRRLDSRPLLETFASVCQKVGAVPVDGTGSDTRVTMKAFLPMVFEPVPNEVLCLGIEWGNSDFGAARHTLRPLIWRLICTNKATMEDSMAQVHLGGRLSDDIQFSARTYQLDTQTSVSALKDVITQVLGPAKVNATLGAIKAAHEKNINWTTLKTQLARKLLKNEVAAIEAAYESDDVINMPEGKSLWRASNAVSWIAGRTEDADRKLELERIAGEVLTGKADKVLEAA